MDLGRRLLRQDGVVSRRQVLALGADRVAAILRRRGWTGSVRRCGPDCGLEVDAA
jgi:hypothetical protein